MTGARPSFSARPTHWLSMPALPSVTTQQESVLTSEPKHVVQAERAFTDESVIAEQPAGGVAHDHIGLRSRLDAFGFGEGLVEAPKHRTAAGDAKIAPRHFLPLRRHQHEYSIRCFVPGTRSGIDKMAHRIERRRPDA